MDFKGEIRKASKDIEDLIKKELKKKGLVDTGKLLKSVSAEIKFDSDGGFTINVYSEDYFKYLDDRYRITEDAFNSSEYDAILEKIEDAYILFIENKLYD